MSGGFAPLDPEFDADAIEKLEDHVIQQRKLVPPPRGLMGRRARGHGFPVSRDWADLDCKAIGCRWNRNEQCIVPSRCKISNDGKCIGFEIPPVKPFDGD